MMDSSSTSTPARDKFFQRLKKFCVPISQYALRGEQSPRDIRQLTELTEQLNEVIRQQLNEDASVINDRLADYIFFPLSHILRHQVQHPARLIETCLRCTTMLIIHGWRAKIAPHLVEQLLILLTFIVGGVPGKEDGHDPSEEIALEALGCLTALINNASVSAAAAASLVDAKNIPALGHTITVILGSATDGKTPEIKLQALHALQAMFSGIKDHAALATFLPGVVSNLAMLLSTPAREKSLVLVAAIESLKTVLVSVLSDLRTRSILANGRSNGNAEPDGHKILSLPWLNATVGQIRLALVNILKLRASDSENVRNAVGNLSLSLLDECHATLENCTYILVESSIILSPEDGPASRVGTSLSDLATIYSELGETIKTIVYSWITGLPRIMQSASEEKKQLALHNVVKGTHLVAQLQLDSSILEDAVSLALRESVSSLMEEDSLRHDVYSVFTDSHLLGTRGLSDPGMSAAEYPLVVLSRESQIGTRSALLALLSKVSSPSHQVKLALEMLDYTRELRGASQVSSYWLSFELIKAALRASSDIEDFLDLSSVTAAFEDPEEALNQLYTYSVSLLDAHDEVSDVDWRLEALALEVAAFSACRSKEAFKPELIDILYPIVTFLGSPTHRLREHAVTTLNILAESCGHTSVAEMLVENADYMVNSISLRMNTLDITPASTRVLIMMTRLTGPRLIPYLDDVVASIFAALDNYHGYPVFVESLFSVLREVVEQGVKSSNLLLEGWENGPSNHRKQPQKFTDIHDVVELLNTRDQRKRDHAKEALGTQPINGHPSQPWGPGKENRHRGIDYFDDEEEEIGTKLEGEARSKTPTYVLLEKVAILTQHYLTSPTPTLRKSLLDLLSTVSPALSMDDDTFLPLVNAVWPVTVSRLHDAEPFVVIAACKALGVMCTAAGDFLASRVKTEWWDGLGKWCRRKKDEAVRKARSITTTGATVSPSTPLLGQDTLLVHSHGTGAMHLRSPISALSDELFPGSGLGRFASAAQAWEAVVELLVSIVSHVRVDDEIFDEILALLADRLPWDTEALGALDIVNADAVWFAMHERRRVDSFGAPQLDNVSFRLEKVMSSKTSAEEA